MCARAAAARGGRASDGATAAQTGSEALPVSPPAAMMASRAAAAAIAAAPLLPPPVAGMAASAAARDGGGGGMDVDNDAADAPPPVEVEAWYPCRNPACTHMQSFYLKGVVDDASDSAYIVGPWGTANGGDCLYLGKITSVTGPGIGTVEYYEAHGEPATAYEDSPLKDLLRLTEDEERAIAWRACTVCLPPGVAEADMFGRTIDTSMEEADEDEDEEWEEEA